MKKGFTMIELLATIIVFTIVATIGSKIVLNVIEKAKEQAFARSVEFAMSSFDFARQYNKPGVETIEITSGDLKLEHNRFKSGTIILNDEGNAKVLYATDGYYCANGLLGNLVVTKGDCIEDLTPPIVMIETTPSLDKIELTIRLNAVDSGLGLDPKAYSFDNGTTWQANNEIVVNSSYKDIIKVRDLANNITTVDYNISKLTINANGGVISGLDEVSIYWLEDTDTMTIPTPIKVGYSFTGWTNVGDSVIDGNNFTMGTIESSLTANYINATFTLQVNPNGGVWDTYTTTQSYSKVYGTTTTINNPTRTGYTFNGWTVSGTNSSINGTTFTMGSANATLTANWTINSYTLTVNANGGSWSGTTPQTRQYNSTLTIANPTKTGYTFNGWTVSGTNSSINGTTFTMGSANASLMANWIDTTPPTCTYTKSNQYTAAGVTVSYSCTDSGSGMATSTSGTYTNKTSNFTITSTDLAGNNSYTLVEILSENQYQYRDCGKCGYTDAYGSWGNSFVSCATGGNNSGTGCQWNQGCSWVTSTSTKCGHKAMYYCTAVRLRSCYTTNCATSTYCGYDDRGWGSWISTTTTVTATRTTSLWRQVITATVYY